MLSFKQARLWFLYRMCTGFAYLYRGLYGTLPTALFNLFSDFALRALVSFVYSRKRIIKNLDRMLEDGYSSDAKRNLARGAQSNLERGLRDCLLQWMAPERVGSSVRIQGVENLQAALSKGNGVIALGAHLGNFILVGARLGIEGYPFHTLIRFPEDRGARSFIESHVPAFYQHLVPSMPRKEAVDRILDLLRKNEIVFILGDNFKRGRVPDRFLGQPIRSSRGPVSLALRSGAPVVPTYLIRNEQGEAELRIDPEIPVKRNGDLRSDIVTNTRCITAYLEGLVRRYPDQWNWLTLRLD